MSTAGYKYLNFSWLIDNEIAGHRGPQYAEHLAFLREKGVKALVRMTAVPRFKPDEIKKAGFTDYYLYIPDMHAPAIDQISKMVDFINHNLHLGKPVGISCDGGFGRTATLLACYLTRHGYSAADAIKEVKRKRPGSILTKEQEQVLSQFASLSVDINPTL
jgi:atypical dual specificity phosphatase